MDSVLDRSTIKPAKKNREAQTTLQKKFAEVFHNAQDIDEIKINKFKKLIASNAVEICPKAIAKALLCTC